VGLLSKKGGGSCVFVTRQKHKYSHQFERRAIWVVRMTAFNNISALLHILAGLSCVAAVGYGWVAVEIYLLQICMHLVCKKNQ
jgi:hypothetical protein